MTCDSVLFSLLLIANYRYKNTSCDIRLYILHMPVVVSFIIPCFNHGKYLGRCLRSIEALKTISYEILIINDGSTDENTQAILKKLTNDGYNVIQQVNAGPGAARNNGISKASGKYIVSLDADDMIRPEYVIRACDILDQYDDVCAVYANYQQFGGKDTIIRYESYSVQKLMLSNTVGSCVIFRKVAWQRVGGYDETLRQELGWEDWDLWLNFAYHGFRFYHLNIVGYDYQYHEHSRERMFLSDKKKVNKIISRFEEKYKGFYAPGAIHDSLLHQIKNHPPGMFLKIFIAVFFPSYYKKLVEKGRIRKYII